MSLPANWSTVTVTGTYLNVDGEPLKGTIAFSTTTRVVDAAANVTVPPGVHQVSLDKDGKFSLVLPATDDPDVAPTGFTYRVDENLVLPSGVRALATYLILLPAATPTVDLADVLPVAPAAEVSPYLRKVDIGTTAGTVAAGDDTRIVGAAQRSVLPLNVKDYGAVGDGVANDTTAIQAAINAASSAASSAESGAAGEGLVYLPAGDYRVTNLVMKSNVNIVGSGYRTTALIATANTGYVLDVSGLSNTTRMANVLIQGITIGPTGSATGGLAGTRPTCGGINMRYSQWCSLRDVFIHNLAGTGIDLTSTFDLVTNNVHLLHTGTDYTTPALLMTGTASDDATNATHHFGMRIERCPVMVYATNSARRPFNNQFVGCKFEVHASGQVAVPGPPIWIEYAQQMTFDACHFVTDIDTQPIIRAGASSGTQTCIGLKFVGCDWIAPTSQTGWAFDATSLAIDPQFVGGQAYLMGKGWTGVSGCVATFSGVAFYNCFAPVIDMTGPQIIGCRFLFTKLRAAESGIYTVRVSSRARVLGSHVQGSVTGVEQPNGISMGNDTVAIGNLLERLPVGFFIGGTNGIVRENQLVSVTASYSSFDPTNSVQTAIRPTVTGSRGGNAALASLLTGLAAQGLIVDSTTA